MKNKIIFVQLETVILIHGNQLLEHGGLSGIRDDRLLESALDRPKNIARYKEDCSICEMAASYAFGIIKNHPFLDGNKRVALVVCLLFLELNGLKLIAAELELYEKIMQIASSQLKENDFASWLESKIQKS